MNGTIFTRKILSISLFFATLPVFSANYIYVMDNNNPMAGQNSVVVIDEDTLSIVSSTITEAAAVGDQVQIAIRPSLNGSPARMYAPGFLAADSVSVMDIDEITGALTHIAGSPFTTTQGTIRAFSQPFGVAVAPDGSIFITNFGLVMGLSVIYKVDKDLNYIAEASTVSSNFSAVAVDSSGTNVYIAATGVSSIFRYDSNLVYQTDVPSGGTNPYFLAIDPTETYIYASHASGGEVSHLNYPDLSGVVSQAGFSMPIAVAFNSDGSRVFVAEAGANQVAVLDTTLTAVVAPLSSEGNNPFITAVDPARARLYTTNTNSGELSVRDLVLDTYPLIAGSPFALLTNPYGIAFTPQIGTSITNLTVEQKKNNFGLLYEWMNVLNWQAPSGTVVTGYNIYRDNILIATLGGSTLTYKDHQQTFGMIVTYSLTSLDASGNESDPIDVNVN